MPDRTLIVFGSGPGIGVGVASAFAARGFTHIALISRDAARLQDDMNTVTAAIQEAKSRAEVCTWTCDLTDSPQLQKVMKKLEGFGTLECVLYNAARVAGKPPLEESVENVEKDFRLTNLALYEVAQWAVPILKKNGAEDTKAHPSFFVTSTTQLYKEPVPELVSLSMVKSAQRALVLSLNATVGGEVHVALLSVGGVVAPDKENLSPKNIALCAWRLYEQKKGEWKREEEVHE